MSFWTLSDGNTAKGDAESAHLTNFSVIPDGTQAPAMIKDFAHEKTELGEFYKVTYKICDGEFKNRVVFQKIKCFDPKKETSDRAISMLKRIYDLTSHKPTHSGAPTTEDLAPMKGMIIGIRIGEWSLIRDDGTLAQGNHITEVHKADSEFETITGVKMESHAVPSALSRNSRLPGLPDDSSEIPF